MSLTLATQVETLSLTSVLITVANDNIGKDVHSFPVLRQNCSCLGLAFSNGGTGIVSFVWVSFHIDVEPISRLHVINAPCIISKRRLSLSGCKSIFSYESPRSIRVTLPLSF